MRRFVGFYWTLEVPWAGFVDLSTNIDEAARQSRTIAYQRALAQRRVREAKGELAAEIAFMELSSDRGTAHGAAAIERAASQCRTHDATLLWVDFSTIGWRDHSRLRRAVNLIEETGVVVEPLSADELVQFPMRENDPLAIPATSAAHHFDQWKQTIAGRREFRDRTIANALNEAIGAVPECRGRNSRIADRLNDLGVPTKTDDTRRRWSADVVRKALEILDKDNTADR